MSDAFVSLYRLICNVVLLSYCACSIIVLFLCYLLTVIIRLKEFY